MSRLSVGKLRPSQILTTFGPGALVDLPSLTVIVLGTHRWKPRNEHIIDEPRLLHDVTIQLGHPVRKFFPAPTDPEQDDTNPYIGVPVAVFPRYWVCSNCRLLAPVESTFFKMKKGYNRGRPTHFVHEGCNKGGDKHPAIPARFVVACERGHLDDFPWQHYVHRGVPCPSAPSRLRLTESGQSGEASDVFVKCTSCGTGRSMAEAFGEKRKDSLPKCAGRRPWLGDSDPDSCTGGLRAILQGASNGYFSVIRSAIAIPEAGGKLEELLKEYWTFLQPIQSADQIDVLKLANVIPRLAEYESARILEAIELRRSGAALPSKGLLSPEWEALTRADSTKNDADFRVEIATVPTGFEDTIAQVVRAERIREVRALIGFTRIESPADAGDEEALDAQRAPLSPYPLDWVPAVEVRGEGIFLRFDEDAVAKWEQRAEVQAWEQKLFQAHIRWRTERKLPSPEKGFPGIRYVLLHSLAHALIRQLSLECGYSSAAVRERIYAKSEGEPMAGILLYTATPDSEGTLGGLVELGKPEHLVRHLSSALASAALCASDPLCAEHDPTLPSITTLNGAACHACLLIAEPSCERSNRYLDRSLLVETLAARGVSYFKGHPA